MDQKTQSISEQGQKNKPSVFLLILTLLMFIIGVVDTISGVPALLISFASLNIGFIIMSAISLIISVGYIIVAGGLLKMKKWSVIVYAVMVIPSTLVVSFNYFSSPEKDITTFVSVGVEIVVLFYILSLYKKFK
ncbi:MAG: hypothetical protein A3J65_04165 [Candidatus Buchananbacteria bacterium RIFCSPHIGHO2_02_FULL_45_11b]|uniref:Uncharacterized protein n=1 Tax=Candidatus Buchananbacteria bacterium RIFCSPHIGHO2_02_FULL_45_11b TaxID=1797541 RepID=A0A1G1YJS4_9BACT|nr:MAG: hypothetical protein A3J65_04165 [Candidatus Buchananbacteria bacterium RIFCSPHIGHO2_02_FULL_45_11b]